MPSALIPHPAPRTMFNVPSSLPSSAPGSSGRHLRVTAAPAQGLPSAGRHSCAGLCGCRGEPSVPRVPRGLPSLPPPPGSLETRADAHRWLTLSHLERGLSSKTCPRRHPRHTLRTLTLQAWGLRDPKHLSLILRLVSCWLAAPAVSSVMRALNVTSARSAVKCAVSCHPWAPCAALSRTYASCIT